MKARFRFKDWGKAQRMVNVLPIACKYTIISDRTTDIYIEVDEKYADYIERYLYEPYNKQ